jgi:hypothetical protein
LSYRWTELACFDFDHNAVSETAPIENGTTGVALATIFTAARHTGTNHNAVNNVAIVHVVARFVVNVVYSHLCNRPVEPKPSSEPSSEVAPKPITANTSLFTGLLPTAFTKIGVQFGLVTRFSKLVKITS